MSFVEIYLIGGAVILGFNTLLWVLSVYLKNSSIVDPVWGMLFWMASVAYFLLSDDGFQDRKILIMGLVTLWAFRLSGYLAWRNWGEGEDFRYVKMRQNRGESWWWFSYIQVFLLQGVLAWIISIPLLAAMHSDSPSKLTVLDGLGLLVWAYGFFFESVGDYQLARFRANSANKGKVLDYGVWRYTRHPNYFGDAAQWWGYGLIALAAGGWWTLYGPALMTYLLIYVSGVAMLERTMKQKPKYDHYMATTSAFFPWLPKNS